MRKYKLFLILISAMFIFTSCSTDPHKGGFFGGVAGLSSGAYNKRIAERKARLERMKANQRALEKENASLKQQKLNKEKYLTSQQKKISKLDQSIKNLNYKINKLKSENKLTGKQLSDITKRSKDLKKQLSLTQSTLDDLEGSSSENVDDAAKRRQLEAQRNKLEKEYKTLLEMTLQLQQ